MDDQEALVRLPGFEPGSKAWEAIVITTGLQPLATSVNISHILD